MAAKRGALIVMEGCDRSGKTTQCKRLGKFVGITLRLTISQEILQTF